MKAYKIYSMKSFYDKNEKSKLHSIVPVTFKLCLHLLYRISEDSHHVTGNVNVTLYPWRQYLSLVVEGLDPGSKHLHGQLPQIFQAWEKTMRLLVETIVSKHWCHHLNYVIKISVSKPDVITYHQKEMKILLITAIFAASELMVFPWWPICSEICSIN